MCEIRYNNCADCDTRSTSTNQVQLVGTGESEWVFFCDNPHCNKSWTIPVRKV